MTAFKTSLLFMASLVGLATLSACNPTASSSGPATASAPAGEMDHSQMDHGSMDRRQMDHGATDQAATTASTKAFQAANAAMHEKMAIAYSGDADKDFIAGMIPHHEGAVAMARVVLEHGKDPQVRKLAEDIIAAQDREISQMKAWQAKNAKP